MSTPALGPSRRQLGMGALALGALGIVFGDIGTSPLYALQTVFSADHHAVKPTEGDVFGVISLVFWSITLIVSIEFVLFIMRADNDGEGGILALIAKVEGAPLRSRRAKAVLIALGMFGVALFYGDGMITPAISVLSAVEGMEVVTPSLESLVLPITIAILVGLFAIQRFGTHVIGRVFGPVMVVWFTVIAAAGLARVVAHPEIVGALSPHHGVAFFADHPGIAFISLGAIVLTITGAEALYADMGHFGRKPIRRAWFLVVFPALTLNYMGQGSLILDTPSAIDNPFFLLIPEWGRIPMVVLATVATVIASQSVISGAFSVTRQAVQLGFLPRLTIRHTSAREIGQVYVPAVNWFLLAAVVALVLGFGSSTSLASAYGIAVTGTITVDTLLFLVVVRVLWRKPGWLVALGAVVFFTIDFAFLGANLTKVEHGGWFPLLGRGRDLHRPQHLEARQREGPHGPHRGGGIAALFRRGAAGDGAAGGAGTGHRRLPQRPPRNDAAGAAGRGRAHRGRARGGGDRLDRDDQSALRAGVRTAGRRQPRLRGRRHQPHHRQVRLPGHPRRAAPARPRRGNWAGV